MSQPFSPVQQQQNNNNNRGGNNNRNRNNNQNNNSGGGGGGAFDCFKTCFVNPIQKYCRIGSHSCGDSFIFAGFVTFYICSFLWDIFVIRGGYLALSMSQMSNCINRTDFNDMSASLVLSMLFIACFHAISMVWIIGYVHSKQISEDCLGGTLTDIPRSALHPSFCIPFLCYDMLAAAQFGLSLYVYSFTAQLIEDEPEVFVDKFCVSYLLVEESYEWLFISLIFFLLTLIAGCFYACLIRIATRDVSIVRGGRQTIVRSPTLSSQQSPQQQRSPPHQNQRFQQRAININNR